MTNIESTGKRKDGEISRRTLTKAGAWAVPAIALAATTPAASASQGKCDPIWGTIEWNTELIGLEDTVAGVNIIQTNAGKTTFTIPIIVGWDCGDKTDLQPVFGNAVEFNLKSGLVGVVKDLQDWFMNLSPLTRALGQVAFDALIAAINLAGDNVVNVKLTIPEVLRIMNNGPVTVNGAAPGGVVAELPLKYNPIAISINSGSQHTTHYTGTAKIQSKDLDLGNNTAVVPVGLDITVIHAVSAALQLVKDLIGLPNLFIRIPIFTNAR